MIYCVFQLDHTIALSAMSTQNWLSEQTPLLLQMRVINTSVVPMQWWNQSQVSAEIQSIGCLSQKDCEMHFPNTTPCVIDSSHDLGYATADEHVCFINNNNHNYEWHALSVVCLSNNVTGFAIIWNIFTGPFATASLLLSRTMPLAHTYSVSPA